MSVYFVFHDQISTLTKSRALSLALADLQSPHHCHELLRTGRINLRMASSGRRSSTSSRTRSVSPIFRTTKQIWPTLFAVKVIQRLARNSLRVMSVSTEVLRWLVKLMVTTILEELSSSALSVVETHPACFWKYQTMFSGSWRTTLSSDISLLNFKTSKMIEKSTNWHLLYRL